MASNPASICSRVTGLNIRTKEGNYLSSFLSLPLGLSMVRMFSPISERVQVERRLQIESALYLYPGANVGLRPRAASNRGHSISTPFFCKPEHIKSYGTKFQATSISTRSLIGLNITFGLRPRATSNRGRSISWPRIRPLSVVA